MSEWYADEKPSGKPFEPPAQEEEVDVTYDEAGKSPLRCGPAALGGSPCSARLGPPHMPSAAHRPAHCTASGAPLPRRGSCRRAVFPRILPSSSCEVRFNCSRAYVPCAADGELAPAEISALSRAGYGRTDDGRFFADEEKLSGPAKAAEAPKPNNESVRLSRRFSSVKQLC